ncbi:hybrid sensor histidine kinase/response regulator [Luteimonas aquatica]|uniref:hybrid sensor histidine kinase/response regulator n=1 Tax=Luteimonas aquatica TaxID=450364 RepID=UPI001F570948|nr:hybrid sensor histidine kinase/response regulator [Luteimonas aquatica]
MGSRAQPLSQVPPWLSPAAAAAAVLLLLPAVLGVGGPWPLLALLLALLAAGAGVYGIRADNERKRVERELGEEIARRDAERLEELRRELERHTQLERELRQAKQAAESALMSKDEFLATMSHEIRTPLNGIVPMLDLLIHASLAPDHGDLVRTAYTSSQQMLRIVDDILDYSKLEADKLELESTGFNLREMLDGVIHLMDRPAQNKGLRLRLQIDPAVRLPVRGDPVRLRQVLSNLVSNAVKFTERGSVTVSVRRIGETGAQHLLHFEVRDTGIGIALDAQARLFQAFTQADASTTRLYGGTGLGLAICKRIVELMGGRIGVESMPGQGAAFWFEVPILKAQGDIPGAPPDAATRGRVLLLSADSRLRLRLSLLLPNWGLRVSAVETTQEAIDRLRNSISQGAAWAYSIVVADLAGMRNTVPALQRYLARQTVSQHLHLVCLYGDEPVGDDLRRSATLLSRQAPDEDLRDALTALDFPAPARTAAGGAAVPHAAAASATLQEARVLLVEDNPVNLMVGQRLLGVLDIRCDTAGNGEIALEHMAHKPYDIVLMDCQMPVMDGYTATRRWRERERAAGDGRHLAIIAMTANAMAGDRQKCLDAGMDDYLPKPVTRAELEACLQRWWNPEIAQALLEDADAAARAAPPPASTQATTATGADAPMKTDMQTDAETEMIAEAEAASGTAVAVAAPAAQAQQAQRPAIDGEILEDLRGLLGGDFGQLVDLFLEDAPRHIGILRDAASAADFQRLYEASHALKNSSANLGAMPLSDAARRVEAGARARTLTHAVDEVAAIGAEFDRARQALLRLRRGPAD